MFGCKQSGSRSQELCLCLRLLRQLEASQESSPRGQPSRPAAAGGQADGQMDGQMDGRTDGRTGCRRTQPEPRRQCGGGFIAEPGHSAGLQHPLVQAS